jgi:chromosome segregation ATPase
MMKEHISKLMRKAKSEIEKWESIHSLNATGLLTKVEQLIDEEEAKTKAIADELEEAHSEIADMAAKLESANEHIAELNQVIVQIEKAFDGLNDDLPRIKADAIDSALDHCAWWHDREFIRLDELMSYADKVRAGEA